MAGRRAVAAAVAALSAVLLAPGLSQPHGKGRGGAQLLPLPHPPSPPRAGAGRPLRGHGAIVWISECVRAKL